MYDVSNLIYDYATNPISNYKPDNYTVENQEWNPMCGDWINVFLKISNNWVIEEFWWTWDTSMVTTAAVSMLAEIIDQEHIDNVLNMNIEDMEELWLEVSRRRRRSLVLWLLAVRNAIHKYKKDNIEDDFDDLWADD